jgi:hypothetical protein
LTGCDHREAFDQNDLLVVLVQAERFPEFGAGDDYLGRRRGAEGDECGQRRARGWKRRHDWKLEGMWNEMSDPAVGVSPENRVARIRQSASHR